MAIPKRGLAEQHIVLKVVGNLAAATLRDWDFVETGGLQIKNIWAEVATAGVTGSTVVDVNLNGSTIFAAAGKITFGAAAAPSSYSAVLPAAVNVRKGDKLSIDVDSVHSGTAPVGLTVHIQLASVRSGDVPTNRAPAALARI